jgi:hypothetical protein
VKLKEFFKPNWMKIILTLIFIGLTYILLKAYSIARLCPMGLDKNCTYVHLPQFPCGACAENLNQFDYVYGNLLIILYSVSFVSLPGTLILIIVPIAGIPLMILYHYIISCLIVWIYYKFKKKK